MSKRFLVAWIILILEPLLFLNLAVYFTSDIQPCKASMFVIITSNKNETTSSNVFIYARDLVNYTRVRFSNATFVIIENQSQIFLEKTSDFSGIELYVKDWKPNERISFRVEQIEVAPNFPLNLTSLYLGVNPSDEMREYVTYDIIFSVFAKSRLGIFSFASQNSFTYRENSGITIQYSYKRMKTVEFLGVFFVLLYLASLYIPLHILFPSLRSTFPFVTLILVISVVFVYVFLGSGWEIASKIPSTGHQLEGILFSKVSFLLHGYDDHIIGNLFYFIPVSLLMEIWLKVKNKLRTFAIWYLIPLLMTYVSPGIGLSLSIESMNWALWIRILLFHQNKTNIDKLMTLISGLSAFPFVNWLYAWLFTSLSTYYRMLADNHVYYGLGTLALTIIIYLVWLILKRRKDEKTPI